jgi:hypothetical protein
MAEAPSRNMPFGTNGWSGHVTGGLFLLFSGKKSEPEVFLAEQKADNGPEHRAETPDDNEPNDAENSSHDHADDPEHEFNDFFHEHERQQKDFSYHCGTPLF